MTHRISSVDAYEILDSRGRPTLSVSVSVDGGPPEVAGVPSGASTGTREAVELRDGDPARYGGTGVHQAVANVTGEIGEALTGLTVDGLAELDKVLIDLDGTDTKSRLGANAIVGVSMAAARAMASSAGLPLYQFLAPDGVTPRLPVPCFNVINGGSHAVNRLQPQEFMICPIGVPSFAEALELIVASISDAGYETGPSGIAIALDPAASEFQAADGRYELVVGETPLSSDEMIGRWGEMLDRYPIWSLEDGLAEDDWDGWIQLTRQLGDRTQLVGDDNLVTNPTIIAEAIQGHAGNAALIKVNQIGTVTETLEAMALCRAAGWGQVVSHRSGETTDTFIADLAVATGCGQIKFGAPARGERVAKYNRLLEIEAHLSDAPFGLSRS